MEKRIVGSFNSDEEVLYAIEELKRQGHRETDMMVVAESTSAIPLVTSRTGVMVEADQQMRTLTGVMMNSYLSMLSAGMVGTQANTLSSRLIERGLPEYTAKHCEEELNKRKIMLLVDTNTTYDSPKLYIILIPQTYFSFGKRNRETKLPRHNRASRRYYRKPKYFDRRRQSRY